jgi:hypothetical protein
MNVIRTAFSIAIMLGLAATPNAFAEDLRDTSTKILTHPVVQTLGTLLNQKHAGLCKVPTTKSDITFRCTGLLPYVDRPTLAGSGCGFHLRIECPTEIALISGDTSIFYIAYPNAETGPGTPEQIEIYNVELRSNMQGSQE